MSQKIKPCPRCGAEAKLTYVLDLVAVSCTNPDCKVTGHACMMYTPWGDCPHAEEDAIQLWNEERENDE